jgi:preprotein translocase subunit SecA
LLLDFFLNVVQLPEENDQEHEIERHEIEEWVVGGLKDSFHHKLRTLGEHSEQISSFIMLSVIDDKWKDHLYDLDHLKASIGFRGWGQKDPLVEYKKEAYEMFVDLMTDLRKSLASFFFRAQLGPPPQQRARAPQRLMYSGPTDSPGGGVAERAAQAARQQPAQGGRPVDELGMSARAASGAIPAGPDPAALSTNRGDDERKKEPVVASDGPGRNDPCPCGSGKKYKKCHGRG